MPFKNPHPLYTVWRSMIERCRNKNAICWVNYGGRGISVCERWSAQNGVGFKAFLDDMGPRPLGYVIDRTDNDKGYSPDNCKWVSKKESQRNRRVTNKIVVDGVEYKVIELSDISGLKPDTILARHKRGLSMNELISPERRVFIEGLKIGWQYGRGGKPAK